MTIRILNLDAVKQNIIEAAMPNIEKIVLQALRDAQPKIAIAFVRAFRRTIVGQSFYGKFEADKERDVVAHIGLTPEDADRFKKEIEDSLKDAIKISPTRRRGPHLSFEINAENIGNKLENEVEGSYISEESGEVIPWLDWLLNGGHVNATIKFEADLKGGFRNSNPRSGRAIMVNFAGKGYWSTDNYLNFSKSGDNFVVDMTTDDRWKADAEAILFKEIAEALQ